MSKTTPGPWDLLRDTRPGMAWNITVVRESDRNYAVCFMTSDGPSEANARLIAAAPEMYEALQSLCVFVEQTSSLTSIEVVDNARAILAKATGAA